MGTRKLAVIGGGKMGEALVAGLVGAGWATVDQLAVVEAVAGRRRELTRRYRGLALSATPVAAAGTVVAVKPDDVEVACRSAVKALGRDGLGPVLSIAAGVPLSRLEAWLGPGVPVVRAMPNTPALVGSGAAAIAAGTAVGEAELGWAEGILGAVGTVVRVEERLLDAVTGLSGSGPAYVLLVIEAMIDAGVLVGLPRPVSAALVTQTVLGTARLLERTGEAPESLRAAVTSPGGTTAAGLRALEDRAVRSAILDAVTAATERSRELGRS